MISQYLQKKYQRDPSEIVSPQIIKNELMLSEREYQEIRSRHEGLFEFREVCQIIEDYLT